MFKSEYLAVFIIPVSPQGENSPMTMQLSVWTQLLDDIQFPDRVTAEERYSTIYLTPDTDPRKPRWLREFGRYFRREFEISGLADIESLTKATASYEACLALTPSGHPEEAQALQGLGHVLVLHYQRFDDIQPSLERGINMLQRSVTLTPKSNLQLINRLNLLGRAFFMLEAHAPVG